MKGLTSITTKYFDVKTRFCSSHFMKISSTLGRWMPPEARPMTYDFGLEGGLTHHAQRDHLLVIRGVTHVLRYPNRKDVSNHERIRQSCCFATSTEANQFWALQSLKTPFINYCQLYLHFHLVHVPFFFPSISPFTLVVCACWSVFACWSDLKLIPSLIYIHLQHISIYTSLSSHPDLVLGDILHPPRNGHPSVHPLPGWDFASSSCWLDLATSKFQWDFSAFWWASVASLRA